MQCERRSVAIKVARVMCNGFLRPGGISTGELGEQILESVGVEGFVATFGLQGLGQRLDGMRCSGTIRREANGNYRYSPLGTNRYG